MTTGGNKIFFLNKHKKVIIKRDMSYLSYIKSMIEGIKEGKILYFPTHKVIEKNRKRNE